jgi:hypothetical protein
MINASSFARKRAVHQCSVSSIGHSRHMTMRKENKKGEERGKRKKGKDNHV